MSQTLRVTPEQMPGFVSATQTASGAIDTARRGLLDAANSTTYDGPRGQSFKTTVEAALREVNQAIENFMIPNANLLNDTFTNFCAALHMNVSFPVLEKLSVALGEISVDPNAARINIDEVTEFGTTARTFLGQIETAFGDFVAAYRSLDYYLEKKVELDAAFSDAARLVPETLATHRDAIQKAVADQVTDSVNASR